MVVLNVAKIHGPDHLPAIRSPRHQCSRNTRIRWITDPSAGGPRSVVWASAGTRGKGVESEMAIASTGPGANVTPGAPLGRLMASGNVPASGHWHRNLEVGGLIENSALLNHHARTLLARSTSSSAGASCLLREGNDVWLRYQWTVRAMGTGLGRYPPPWRFS
jgi:hypothetical protein